MHVFALTVHAISSLAVRVVTEGQKRRHIVARDEPDVASVTAVAAVRASEHNRPFSAEADAACPAIACLHI
jgi:hypothetical protein